jgi:hypothetical protein
MKMNIDLPFFPGFYETSLENSDTAYWAIKEELEYYQDDCDTPCKELTEDDLEFRYEDYEKDVRENWAAAWKENTPEIVLSMENVTMWSPRYYNFDHDRLYADIELADNWQDVMQHFMDKNYDWLKDRIYDDWTSYDGFMSFMSNDVDEWGDFLFNKQDVRYISTMLGYMMYRENGSIRNDLVMYALDDVYAGSYVELTEEGKEKIKAGIEDGSIKVYDPNQLTIPFEN